MMTIDKPMGEDRLVHAFESVGLLTDQVSVHQRHQKLVLAVTTWVAAVQLFKSLRAKQGLPENVVDKLGYGAIVANLKATGKAIQQWRLMGFLDLARAELDDRTIAGLLDEICGIDRRLENGLLDESLDDVLAAFPEA